MGRLARPLPSYGVHWADGIAFLVQRSGITNALGLDFPSPFEINDRVLCPHDIRVPQHGVVHPQSDDPLFWVMSPLPGAGIYIVPHTHAHLVPVLERLSSPIEPLSTPYWYWGMQGLRAAMTRTNCAPLVLTGVRLKNVGNLPRLAELTRVGQRRVVLVADEPLPRDDRYPVIRSEMTTIEEPHLLRPAGAHLLTEYMLSGKVD